jgi:hypothetical protein
VFHLIQALNHNLCLKNEAFLSDTLIPIHQGSGYLPASQGRGDPGGRAAEFAAIRKLVAVFS